MRAVFLAVVLWPATVSAGCFDFLFRGIVPTWSPLPTVCVGPLCRIQRPVVLVPPAQIVVHETVTDGATINAPATGAEAGIIPPIPNPPPVVFSPVVARVGCAGTGVVTTQPAFSSVGCYGSAAYGVTRYGYTVRQQVQYAGVGCAGRAVQHTVQHSEVGCAGRVGFAGRRLGWRLRAARARRWGI